MKTISPNAPIGVFDSGIGGLTVANAIQKLLPDESMVYFGDTAHLPYGDKSEAAIQAYSIRIADVLLDRGCKVIVIACNSASSAAYELLREYVHQQAGVIDVINPMVSLVCDKFAGKKVGLIGTRRTVQSGIYSRKFSEADQTIALHSVATPLLAPMIEEGYFNNKISHEIIEDYLSDPALDDIDALILACTHYPLIKREIASLYKRDLAILDSSEVAALALQRYLTDHGLLAKGKAVHSFLVSDYTDSFEAATRIFFEKEVHLEKHPLWN